MSQDEKTLEELIQFHRECLLLIKIISSAVPGHEAEYEPVIRIREALIHHYEAIRDSGRSEWYAQWVRNEKDNDVDSCEPKKNDKTLIGG